MKTLTQWIRNSGPVATALTGAAVMLPSLSHAIGSDSDGWNTPQVGHPLAITYFSRKSTNEAYSDGKKVSDNTNIDSTVAMFRYLHPVDVGNDVIWTPNVLLPFASVETAGDAGALGDKKGMGDLGLVSGFWPIHDREARKHFAIVPFLWLPTGDYDKDDALNLGENRYRFALQLGGQFALSDAWDFSGSVDTTWYGENDDTEMKQKPLTQIDGWLKYNMQSSMYSHVAVGLSQKVGGETEVAGVSQDDRTSTTTAKLQFGTLIDDSMSRHALFTVAQDLTVENGTKSDAYFELRLTQVF